MSTEHLYGTITTQEKYIKNTYPLNNLLIDIAEYFIRNEYKVYFPIFNDINNSSENGLKDIFTKFYVFYKGHYIELEWKNDIENSIEESLSPEALKPVVFEVKINNILPIIAFNILLKEDKSGYNIDNNIEIKESISNAITTFFESDRPNIICKPKLNFVVQINSILELQKFKFNL